MGVKTPDIFRYVFHSESLPPGGANRGRLLNQQIDAFIEDAEAVNTLEQKALVYHELQRELHRLLPYVSLWYEENIAFYRDDIEGYQVSADGNYDGLIHVNRV